MAKRYASIDIGTNTLRLLIAEIDNKNLQPSAFSLQPVYLKRIITRLGGDYKEERGIDQASQERTIKALGIFSAKIHEYGVEEVRAVATSVVRRARNKREFLKNVLEKTGLEIKVISGDEEARLSMFGVLSVIGANHKKCLIVDIGGGSTEFIAVDSGKMVGAWSMEMGVVHLTERYLKTDPPTKEELKNMEEEIERVMSDLRPKIYDVGFLNPKSDPPKADRNQKSEVFIGTAGTITTLAAIDQGLEKYEPSKINNYILSYNAVKRIYYHLASLPLKKREEILALEKGREDIIIPGAAIVLRTMDNFGFDKMTVSDAGLLEGILLDSCA